MDLPAAAAARASPWLAVALAAAVLAAGMLAAAWGAALAAADPAGVAAAITPRVPVPGWIFWAVWVVNYPCLGVATAVVWSRRHAADVAMPLALFAVNLLVVLAFMPLMGIARDVRAAAMLDVLALVSGYVAAFGYARVARGAALWLAPYLLWLPLTTALKVWAVFA